MTNSGKATPDMPLNFILSSNLPPTSYCTRKKIRCDLVFLFVAFEGPPQILSMPTNVIALKGQPFSLSCHATGFPTPTVDWKKNNEQILNNTNLTVSAPCLFET